MAQLAAALALLATSGAGAATVTWNGNAGNGSLSDGGNWDGGAAPVAGDTLDFSAITSATTLNADFGDGRTFASAILGTGVLTLSGDLRVNTLTNAYTLAVSSTGSLTVTGDLVATVESRGGSSKFLHSNEGTVTVGGKAIGYSNVGNSVVYEYAAVTGNTRPIIARGIAYKCGSSGQLYMKLQSNGNNAGSWVVGADGFSFASVRNAAYSTFWAQYASVTLYSSADWTLANSKKYNTSNGDLYVPSDSGSSLVIDTSDYTTPANPHTITLNGRIVAYNPVTIMGCGTVVVNTTGSSTSVAEDLRHTCITNETTLSVTDTATLQINAGKKITGNGTISLASGTKLLLPNAGGGTATIPSLAPAAGSTIAVSNLVVGMPAIAITGGLTLPDEGSVTLKIGGTSQLADGIYTVISATDALPSGAVNHITFDASAVVSGDCSLYAKGGVLLLLVGVSEPGNGIWVGGADTKMSTAVNWLNDTVPVAGDTLNFMAVATATTLNADFGDDRTFASAKLGSGVLTLTGSLRVNTLTNAHTLAIASTGSLAVTGDLVGYAGANENKPLLYSNYGTVTVGGRVRFRDCGTSKNECHVSQYAVADENSTPIIADGLAYHAAKTGTSWYSGYLVANLGSIGSGPGKWVVGAGGFTFPASRDIGHSGFRANNQEIVLYSSANWTLDQTYRHTGNDLYIRGTGMVTIDTTDYNDHTTPRTVTLKGYVNAQDSAATQLTITGNGKVVLASVTANNHTNVVTGTIAVTNNATLQINKDVVVGGAGGISLAAGTTLALPANADRTLTARDIVPVMLPAEGTATLCIDGDAPLLVGDHVLFNHVPAGYATHLAVVGTAISGHPLKLKDDGEHLILNIQPNGTTILIK